MPKKEIESQRVSPPAPPIPPSLNAQTGMTPQQVQVNDCNINLSEYAYSSNLRKLHIAISEGKLDSIAGYSEFSNFPTLGFDMLSGAFVTGALNEDILDDQLTEMKGPDYSRQFMIITLVKCNVDSKVKST